MTSYAAFGTLLKAGDGAGSETFTTIAQVQTIGGPSLSQDAIDVTHHSSTNGWREFVAGLRDGGEVTFDIQYDPAGATHDAGTGIINDLENGTLRNFQLVFPDTGSTTWSFSGIYTAFEPSAPVDDKLSASVSIKVSGQPTLA